MKKREFRNDIYWGKPVPSFGDPHAKLWIIGLAPAAHGANRTGRMFTGDKSGEWLYRALYLMGWASLEKSESAQDGMELKQVYISATAHCAPPDNKPTLEELANCQSYLDDEFDLLLEKKVILALGQIAFQSVLALLQRKGIILPQPKPKFSHNGVCQIGDWVVLTSYHPSRQNTQTGRLSDKMWMDVFKTANSLMTKGSFRA